jgi:hypothetical protein
MHFAIKGDVGDGQRVSRWRCGVAEGGGGGGGGGGAEEEAGGGADGWPWTSR